MCTGRYSASRRLCRGLRELVAAVGQAQAGAGRGQEAGYGQVRAVALRRRVGREAAGALRAYLSGADRSAVPSDERLSQWVQQVAAGAPADDQVRELLLDVLGSLRAGQLAALAASGRRLWPSMTGIFPAAGRVPRAEREVAARRRRFEEAWLGRFARLGADAPVRPRYRGRGHPGRPASGTWLVLDLVTIPEQRHVALVGVVHAELGRVLREGGLAPVDQRRVLGWARSWWSDRALRQMAGEHGYRLSGAVQAQLAAALLDPMTQRDGRAERVGWFVLRDGSADPGVLAGDGAWLLARLDAVAPRDEVDAWLVRAFTGESPEQIRAALATPGAQAQARYAAVQLGDRGPGLPPSPAAGQIASEIRADPEAVRARLDDLPADEQAHGVQAAATGPPPPAGLAPAASRTRGPPRSPLGTSRLAAVPGPAGVPHASGVDRVHHARRRTPGPPAAGSRARRPGPGRGSGRPGPAPAAAGPRSPADCL